MSRLGLVAACGLVPLFALSSGSCNRDVEKRLKKIEKNQEEMKQMLARGGGAGKRRGKRRPRPDARAVYAVPIQGSASTGPDNSHCNI